VGSLVSDANSRNVRRVWAGSSEATVIFERGGKHQCVPAIVCYSSPACTPIFHPSISHYCSTNFQAIPQKVKVRVPCNHFNYSRLCVGASLRRCVLRSSVFFGLRHVWRDYFAFASTLIAQLKNTRLSSHLCNRVNIPVKNENPSATCQNCFPSQFSTTRSCYCPADENGVCVFSG
jgi:hypothetical protein